MELISGMNIVVLNVVDLTVGIDVVGIVFVTFDTLTGVRHSVDVKFSVIVCIIGRYDMLTKST